MDLTAVASVLQGALSSYTGNMAASAASKKQYKYNKWLQAHQYEYNKSLQADQFNYNKSLQLQQQDYLTKMSNTAHQREIADLKAAGINPLLTATGGNGAATVSGGLAGVSGASVSGSSVGMPNSYGLDSDAIQNALTAKRIAQESKMNEASIAKLEADKENQTRDSKSYADLTKKQVENIEQERKTNALIYEKLTKTLPGEIRAINSANSLHTANNTFDNSVIGQFLTHVPKVGSAISSFLTPQRHSAKVPQVKGYNYFDSSGKYTGSRQNVY